MGFSSFQCAPPVCRRPPRRVPDYETLEDAIALFDRGEHRAAVARTLEHLLGHPIADFGEAPLRLVQGSARLSLRLEGEALSLSVPLVRLVEPCKTTAALRYVLTRISGSGQLQQPRLAGDEVRLEFSDELRRLHPPKLLEVLRRMLVEADEHDDWMVDQFGVEALEPEPLEPLGEDEIERAIAIWQKHWADVDELLKESQRKRSMFFLNELTAYAVFHLKALVPISGAVLSRITERAATFNASDSDPSQREAALAKCVREMKAIDLETLRGCLGHASYTVSPLSEGGRQLLEHYFGDSEYLHAIDAARSGGRHLDAALATVTTYYYLLARFSFREATEEALWAGLARVDGKPLRETSGLLLAAGRDILTEHDEFVRREREGEEPEAPLDLSGDRASGVGLR